MFIKWFLVGRVDSGKELLSELFQSQMIPAPAPAKSDGVNWQPWEVENIPAKDVLSYLNLPVVVLITSLAKIGPALSSNMPR